MPCSSLIVLTLAEHPRGSSSQQSIWTKPVWIMLWYKSTFRFTGFAECVNIQVRSLYPQSSPFWQRAKTAAQERAQPSLSWEPRLVKGMKMALMSWAAATTEPLKSRNKVPWMMEQRALCNSKKQKVKWKHKTAFFTSLQTQCTYHFKMGRKDSIFLPARKSSTV